MTDRGRALEWNPQGRRMRGRPAQTRKRSRLAELQANCVTWAAAKKTAQQRIRWNKKKKEEEEEEEEKQPEADIRLISLLKCL